MDENTTAFKELVVDLTAAGYNVEIKPIRGTFFASVTGKGIYGGFGEPSDQLHPYTSGRAAFDHAACFDKWSKCPMVVKIPSDTTALLKHLELLGSDKGRDISDKYEYLDNNPWPFDVD